MQTKGSFDLIVIGSGPAGESGAVTAALMGKRVCVVERNAFLGGSSANTGTLPSKTLRETALAFAGLRARKLYGVDLSLKREATIQELMYHERHVKNHERDRILHRFRENRVDLHFGSAAFVDPHSVMITPLDPAGQPKGQPYQIRGDHVLIATGSSPVQPLDFPFGDDRIHDSDEILQLRRLPRSLLVVGAGVIGSEYACTFAALGVKVTVADGRHELLPFLDADISAALERSMRDHLGITFLWGETVTGCTPSTDPDGPVTVTMKSGLTLDVEGVLVAAGRNSNTGSLNLAAAGLEPGKRGIVPVNKRYQTAVPHIYAAGDVVGPPGLAATGKEQARIAMTCALSGRDCTLSPLLPTGIYTIPEVSMVGAAEDELKSQGVDYVVGRALYSQNARGEIIGERVGYLKLIFRTSDRRLLGVHVIGESASDVLHTGLMAMLVDGDIELFDRACFNYPTLGGLYKDACNDALFQLTHPQGEQAGDPTGQT